MKSILILFLCLICFFGNAQSGDVIFNEYWSLNKIETTDTILSIPSEFLEPLFIGVLFDENYDIVDFSFNENENYCGNLTANCVVDVENFSFLASNPELDLEPCFTEENNEIAIFFMEEFLFDDFMQTWHNPFTYSYPDPNSMIVTNSVGSMATFNVTLLSNQNFQNPTFSIYPNPAKDKVFIEHEFLEIRSVQIYNLKGKLILQQKGLSDNGLEISYLTKGLFIVKIESNQGTFTQKLIKE